MYDYYVERLNEVRNLSCKPEGISMVRDGYIFDEDKSVKWNREQVTKNNQKYQDEVKRLNQEKMRKREEVYSDFYKDILESLSIATGGKKFSTGQAKIIWKYMEGHLQDSYDIASPLDELIDMIADFVTYKPTKQSK
jgi:hypothetical protein